MSAELTYTKSRVADVFSVRLPMWHRDGHILPDHPSLEEAVDVINGNFVVGKVPTQFQVTDGRTMRTIQSALAFLTVRMDTGAELGSVGPDYVPVNNLDAFRAAIGPLVDEGLLVLETGGVLREGADVWLLARWNFDKFGPIARGFYEREGVLPYVFVKINHSGRRSNEIGYTDIRIVCANTLGMTEQQIDGGHTKAVAVRHTGDHLSKMTEAATMLFHNAIARAEKVAAAYTAMREQLLTMEQFHDLVLVPAIGIHPTRRPNWEPAARMAESVVERWETRKDAIVMLWDAGTGHTGDHSAWEAYNALVEAVDHHAPIFPTRSGVYRTAALLDGRLRQIKDVVLDNLAALANVEELPSLIGAGASIDAALDN
jgi:phage/plasmid-like protein (TIGR03299 family)